MIFFAPYNNPHPPSTFSLLLPLAFFYLQTITNHKITDPQIIKNNFFYGRTNHKSQRRKRYLEPDPWVANQDI